MNRNLYKTHINGIKYYLPESRSVKIIDLGNVYTREDYHDGTVNTRQYRAPEIILSSLTRVLRLGREE